MKKIISIDTETKSLEDKTILAISVSDESRTIVLPIRMNTTKNVTIQYAIEYIKDLLKNCKVVFHNSSFDIPALVLLGIPLGDFKDIEDTVIISRLLDENIRHGLKSLSKRYLHHTMIEYKEVCGTGKKQISFADVEWEKAKKYSSQDAYYTWKLFAYLYPKLQQEKKLFKIYEEIERPLLKVVADMHIHGISINVDKVKEISDLCILNIDSITERLEVFLGKDFNINSSKQLKEYFIDKLKMPVLKVSNKTNSPSVDKEVLEKYAEKNNVAQLILDYRKYKKIYSTFIPALTPNDWDSKNKIGKIYASFNQAGTVSGRFSSSSPNMQNIPREKDEYGIRETIIADKGQILVGADYSQIELRVLAHATQDPNLLKAYREGQDIHQMTADACGITRDEAKRVNFGIAYGMGAKTLAKRTDKTYDEAQQYIEKYHQTYPKVVEFWNSAKLCIKGKGFVETVLGRKRRRSKEFFDKDDFEKEMEIRSMTNHIIQGTAADLIKIAMVSMYPELKNLGARIVLTVHDEVIVSTPRDKAEKVKKIITNSMMEAGKILTVPVAIDIKFGNNWNETHGEGIELEEEIDEEG